MKKKTLLIALCAIVLAVLTAASVTVAWLTAQTNPVTNTFSIGNINITLTESENTYKVIPGGTDLKDPKVTVLETSEPCYVYVLVENNLVIDGTVVGTPNIGSEWISVKTVGTTKTLYRYKDVVDARTAEKVLPVFTEVNYDGAAITSQNIASLENKTIVIDAFAHQADNLATTEDAAIAFANEEAIKHFTLN
jgi:hypothetical protein